MYFNIEIQRMIGWALLVAALRIHCLATCCVRCPLTGSCMS